MLKWGWGMVFQAGDGWEYVFLVVGWGYFEVDNGSRRGFIFVFV
jgi:hypothetical protein